jgi:hypothetical protein
MKWQDIVLSIGQWVFIIALIPTLLSKKDKPPVSSSILTGFFLAVYTSVYASYHLWTALVSDSILALVWFTIAYQKYSSKKEEKEIIS